MFDTDNKCVLFCPPGCRFSILCQYRKPGSAINLIKIGEYSSPGFSLEDFFEILCNAHQPFFFFLITLFKQYSKQILYEIICLTNIDCTKVRLEQGWDFALWFFRANRSFFVSEIATRSWLLFFKEQQEQFAHSHSFLQSNESYLLPLLFTNSKESNLLTVALFYRATRAIRSHCSLQKSNEVKSDRRASLLCIKGDKNGENEFF